MQRNTIAWILNYKVFEICGIFDFRKKLETASTDCRLLLLELFKRRKTLFLACLVN